MLLRLGDDTITFSAPLLVGLDCLTNNHSTSSEGTICLLGDFLASQFRWFEAKAKDRDSAFAMVSGPIPTLMVLVVRDLLLQPRTKQHARRNVAFSPLENSIT